ncbi:MAG: TolC family protein [Desulfobacterales bacterium]|nr:TolC family protein [Desulfobacterales bacterium]
MKRSFKARVAVCVITIALQMISRPLLGSPIAHEIPVSDFGSLLTLDEAVQRTIKDDASLKQARERLMKEEALYKGKLAEFLPKLGSEGFQGLATGNRQSLTFFDTYVEQPIFLGGKSVAEKRKQRARVENESLQLEQVKSEVELSVRILYVELLKEKELTRIAQGEVIELGRHLERTQNLYEREAVPRFEVLRAESLLQGAKHALVKHKETYDYLSAVLRETIGLGESETIEMEPLGEITEIEPDFGAYLASARLNDPIYKIKQLEIEEKKQEKRILEAERYPHISLAAKWNLYKDVFVDTNRFVVGLAAKWNIWDFGRLGSEIKAKDHEMEEAKWAGTVEIRRKEKELRRLYHEARSAREKIRLHETLRREREEEYKNEKVMHIAGQKGTNEILDVWISREAARMDWVKAVSEYRSIMARLAEGAGQL